MSLERLHYDGEGKYHFPSAGEYTNYRDYESHNGERPSPGTPMGKVSYLIPLLLFIITVVTTLLAGAFQQGVNPFKEPWKIYKGLPFSLALLAILLTHEMGHFLTSRRHGVEATLPYFIPAPTFLGTFGAFIKMRSPILNKNALIDIGASGPLSGFVVSLIVTFWGLKLSTLTSAGLEESLKLGTPLIFRAVSYLSLGPLPETQNIILHPMAFAGWIGFFVTSLNLLPIGQLDGGHIVYAAIGKRHRVVSIIMLSFLVFFGYGWAGWWIWAVLVTILGIGHPPIMDTYSSLDRNRKMVGWLTLLVFLLTFTPMPFFIG